MSQDIIVSKHYFTGTFGDKLAARLDAPPQPSAYVLFAHYFTGNKDVSPLRRIARALCANNIGLFRFDYTGLGDSEGDFAKTNFSSNIQDLILAANYMRQTLDAPHILVGHSLGGTAAIAAASSIPEVKAIATIGSPCDSAHVKHNFNDYLDEINDKGSALVTLGGKQFNITKQFLEDIHNQDMLSKIATLKKALLVIWMKK